MNRRDFLRQTGVLAAAAMLPAHSSIVPAHADAPSPPTQPADGQMLMRTIPSTGQFIPAFGMGTWQTFDIDPADENALRPLAEVLEIFFAAGGRVIDSSPMYGRAEEVTGLLSRRLQINDGLFLATKVWTDGEQAGPEQMRRSLDRLHRQRIELMQIHNLRDWRTHLRTLRAWKDRGTFRYIGITHYAANHFDEMERILRSEKLDFIQLPYSIAMRAAERRLLPAARDTGAAVLVMRPFEGGNLFAATRNRPLPAFAQGFASTWAEAFLKFILAHDAVTCVIPATSKPQHMRDNLRAAFGRLPSGQERERLVDELR